MNSYNSSDLHRFPILDSDEADLILWIKDFVTKKNDLNDETKNEIVSQCDKITNVFYMEYNEMILFNNTVLGTLTGKVVKENVDKFVDLALPFIITIKDYALSLKSRGCINQYEINQIQKLSSLAIKIRDLFCKH